MGFFEKRRLAKFVKFVDGFDAEKPDTHQVRPPGGGDEDDGCGGGGGGGGD